MFKASETIAIFGGSFDPPHIGHQSIVNKAILMLDIDKLIIIPAFLNPFKSSSLATPEQRLTWTEKIFAHLPKVSVDPYEIQQGKPTPTVQSVRHFQQSYDVRYLIIGSDNLSTITQWSEFAWLNQHITWVIATRKNCPVETQALRTFEVLSVDVPISSTEIRDGVTMQHIDESIQEDVHHT
ncbi:MAG TPA: nicotinate (nicotinamide) nucleotide adenylyltransferase, partial [Campylobacterales bacterium]|nr:nicotinate (nicotinamide) nucleotide adenylyltransferase [Campylobacterales bacterium]